jgi:hypothetical protein
MSDSVVYAGSAAALAGPSISFSAALELQGHNFITVDVPKKKNATVDLGVTADELRILLIKPSITDPALTFAVNAGTPIALDAPLVLGGSAASALIAADVKANSVTFDNKTTSDITIDIFVGRKL